MKQKFKRGQKVYICKNLGENMSHFTKDCNAIINYTYSEIYGGNDIKSYSLLILDNEDKPINMCSWYEEWQLTLISDFDIDIGCEMLEEYNLRF
jgi:hypothetical protein